MIGTGNAQRAPLTRRRQSPRVGSRERYIQHPPREGPMSATEQTPTPHLDATISRFLEQVAAQGGPPICALSPTAARAVLTAVQAGPFSTPEVDSEDSTISG